MIVFDAGIVLRAITSLRQLETVINNYKDNETHKKTDDVDKPAAKIVRGHLKELSDALKGLQARATEMGVKELDEELAAHKIGITYEDTSDWIRIIAVTLRRELSLIRTFCVAPTKEAYYELDIATFGAAFKADFTSSVFEIDEAAKCYALGRPTACVFHLMRAMEIGIKAVVCCLGIPDPAHSGGRNWGNMLSTIKKEIDRRSAAKSWKNSDKDLFERSYVSLDAVRIAWRNTTMHVENKYTDDEAEHIFVAVRGFMKSIAARMNEAGEPKA